LISFPSPFFYDLFSRDPKYNSHLLQKDDSLLTSTGSTSRTPCFSRCLPTFLPMSYLQSVFVPLSRSSLLPPHGAVCISSVILVPTVLVDFGLPTFLFPGQDCEISVRNLNCFFCAVPKIVSGAVFLPELWPMGPFEDPFFLMKLDLRHVGAQGDNCYRGPSEFFSVWGSFPPPCVHLHSFFYG